MHHELLISLACEDVQHARMYLRRCAPRFDWVLEFADGTCNHTKRTDLGRGWLAVLRMVVERSGERGTAAQGG